jgi:hypothetical protein
VSGALPVWITSGVPSEPPEVTTTASSSGYFFFAERS